jgi:hypothetical protein
MITSNGYSTRVPSTGPMPTPPAITRRTVSICSELKSLGRFWGSIIEAIPKPTNGRVRTTVMAWTIHP